MAVSGTDNMLIHCAICGAPTAKHQPATLLSDPARELEVVIEHFATKWGPSRFTTDRAIDELRVANAGRCFFTTNDDDDEGRRATAYASEDTVPGADRYYIPVHDYCLSLTKRILASGDGRVQTMRQLWKVLRTRCLATVAGGRTEPLAGTDAPDDYHLPPRPECESREDRWCTADAWDVPDLTAGVLASMTPSKPPSLDGRQAEFRARFERLPQEMQDHILSFVFTEQHFPPDCTYLIPQGAWMNLLLQGQVVPYLWDLDRREVEKKVAEGRERGVEWDFELLVRRLCQARSMADGAPLASMPAGLRNRQRVWKLVQDMYVGDFLPETPAAAAIPRYWDEDGNLQYPLVWIRR